MKKTAKKFLLEMYQEKRFLNRLNVRHFFDLACRLSSLYTSTQGTFYSLYPMPPV
jgi:hypothetical protein